MDVACNDDIATGFDVDDIALTSVVAEVQLRRTAEDVRDGRCHVISDIFFKRVSNQVQPRHYVVHRCRTMIWIYLKAVYH